MTQWLRRQLPLNLGQPGGWLILDPEGLVPETDLPELKQLGQLYRLQDWAQLRRCWDLTVRLAPASESILGLLSQTMFQRAEDLPWDIEQEAAGILSVQWPVPKELHELFRTAPTLSEALAKAAERPRPLPELLQEALQFQAGDSMSELSLVLDYSQDPNTPLALWGLLHQVMRSPLARLVIEAQGDLGPLQKTWEEWLQTGSASKWHSEFERVPVPVIKLLEAGLLRPASRGKADLPIWVSLGTLAPDPHPMIHALLAQHPVAPTTFKEWTEVALWWARLRATLAAHPATLSEAEPAWQYWKELNQAFQEWLKAHYGSMLLASASLPQAVHQIAPFLARRQEAGAKVLLLVLDGLGYTQWLQILSLTQLKVLHGGGCLAMLPTLTSISRQAILSGKLPLDFPDTWQTTTAEARRWRDFWLDHGVAGPDIDYLHLKGNETAMPEWRGKAVAVVINAIDLILHGAEILGDRQVAAGVELWVRSGFLEALVRSGRAAGYEIWVASDHGNLPVVPGPVLQEGQLVEAAGARVRLYPNRILREQASSVGYGWDPPGFVRETSYPLFAREQQGFGRNPPNVSHGGLSLDEVIVPFAEVSL